MGKQALVTHFMEQIIPLIDQGFNVSIEEILKAIDNKGLVPYLTNAFPQLDFSIVGLEDKEFLEERYQDMRVGYTSGGKWGVKNNGLLLLVAWGTALVMQENHAND